jgi:hypothetical protein
MASEGTGSTVGKGLVDEQAAGSAVSAALTAADPQVSISLPGSAQNSSETIVGHELLQQLPRTSSLPAAGVMDRDGFQPGVLTSTPPAVTVSQTLPQGSSQSTELRFQQSSASSGLADQTTGLAGQATTTGLLEAMQHLHLQVGAGPSSTQQMTAPVYAAQANSTASVGSIGPSTSLQDSGDLMQLMGHVQQQHHQLTQEQEQQGQPLLELSQQQAVQAEDGTATVCAISLLLCVGGQCLQCVLLLMLCLSCNNPCLQVQAPTDLCGSFSCSVVHHMNLCGGLC